MTDQQSVREAETLLPCPFCGGAPCAVPQNDDCPVPAGSAADGAYYLTIWCENCGAEGGKRLKAAEAIAAWNRRSLPANSNLCPECIRKREPKTPPQEERRK